MSGPSLSSTSLASSSTPRWLDDVALKSAHNLFVEGSFRPGVTAQTEGSPSKEDQMQEVRRNKGLE